MLAVLVSQALFALTETSPPFAPTVALIDVDVEIPVHPEGKLHVYDVAAFHGWQVIQDSVNSP